MKKNRIALLAVFTAAALVAAGIALRDTPFLQALQSGARGDVFATDTPEATYPAETDIKAEYSGAPYEEINGNVPFFEEEEYVCSSFESYSPLDGLGRCGAACACIGTDIMPTAAREPIGAVTPSGWHTVKYGELIDGNYLYNRCHLIAFELAGENANERNLITGTRYMNVEGMLPFENKVAAYVRSTGNHVLYRVTPVFSGENLLADGVLMEACSVEDGGEGVRFCVYVFNVQPGISIDYKTGESRKTEALEASESENSE
ncbi:MAG: DNA/RNA non-specific endonuclease [Butyrivibrio sp.]|nr:DNA/RNA non-specific endonuclease [Butyrivibrio sp.]